MIEIIATKIEDVLEIKASGAQRIELVSALSEGGITPSYGLIEAVVKAVCIPVNVMIRPHSMGFVYTDAEIELMKKDILCARDLGANGVVFGVLCDDNKIDVKKLESLLSVCAGLDVTFHRAIDETDDVVQSMRLLSEYKAITTVLTSGGLAMPIEDNVELIKKMIVNAGHIDVLVGGGLTLGNVECIQSNTGAKHFHFGTAAQTNGVVDRKKIMTLMNELKEEL